MKPLSPYFRIVVLLAGTTALTGCLLTADTDLPPRPDGDFPGDGDVVDEEVSVEDVSEPERDLENEPEPDGSPTDLDAPPDDPDTVDSEPDPDVDVADATDCGPPLAFEVCGDCIDNDCDEDVDETDCRAALALSIQGEAESGYAVSVTFDHEAAVDAGQSRDDGQDVRVWFREADEWVVIDRVLDPLSSWAASDTTLWFALRAEVAAGSPDERYLIELGTEDVSPPDDEAAVFHYADLFERPDSTSPGGDWDITAGAGAIQLEAGALVFATTGDLPNRPFADVDFPALVGRHAWRLGFNWTRSGAEGSYRLHMQLGDASSMDVPDDQDDTFANAGAGPSLMWAGPNQGMSDHSGFGYEVDGAVTQAQVLSGAADVEVRLDPSSSTYDVWVDGERVAEDVAFSDDPTALDRVRLLTWQVSDANFADRQFDYVIIRPLAEPEPTATAAAISCSE